ncbi:MAG TPA: hypothetical protein VE546_10385 [Streptomyces sp.]|uniref:hypothetical protein n=1 Tax=Streptomyces sp. TaxID=1931 RepID=UPI002D4BD873|nr:hypothetical protein [Streptomyces sp.]HZG03966.1 hypothetical protein [Streptomyces sp.]
MISLVDRLLARARLRPAPYTQREIDAAEDRLAARLAHPAPPGTGRDRCDAPVSACVHTTASAAARRARQTAARDLRTLCETVVTHTGSLTRLEGLLTRRVLQPAGAGVLGCLLHLAEREDAARFWWQYAAGAGDHTALYCLYLHHRALGESAEASWWYRQADFTPLATDEQTTEHELARALRILYILKSDRGLPDHIGAIIAYVPDAVDFIDGFDLPILEEGFADRIDALTTTAGSAPRRRRRRAASPLPERKSGRRAPATAGRP